MPFGAMWLGRFPDGGRPFFIMSKDYSDPDVQREMAHAHRMRSIGPGDISLDRPRPSPGMRQVDRPVMQHDRRRAAREMKRPIFGGRKVSR